MTNPWAFAVTPHYQAHFEPLCQKMGLVLATDHPHGDIGFASAESGCVRVHFEHDRGLCYLALGPSAEQQPLCSVEEMAQRFPRATRALSKGYQRLSLEQQRRFIEFHWGQLQVMFSPEHLAETRRWRQAQGEAFLRTLGGGS